VPIELDHALGLSDQHFVMLLRMWCQARWVELNEMKVTCHGS